MHWLPFLVGFTGFCKSECELGEYNFNGSCNKCDKNCLQYNPKSGYCEICGYFLYLNIDTHECLEFCPNGYYV